MWKTCVCGGGTQNLRGITTEWNKSTYIYQDSKRKDEWEWQLCNIQKENITENFPKLIKDMNPKLKEKSLSKADRERELENHHLATIRTIDSGKKSLVDAETSVWKFEQWQDIYSLKVFPLQWFHTRTI